MGVRLMRRHGLDDWTLVFDRAKRRAGVCRHATRSIGLSAPLTQLYREEEVRQTLLHEIAHALAGPTHAHDAVWRGIARSIGSTAERCVPADMPTVPAPWVGTCPAGHRVERHRRPMRVQACGRCSGTFAAEHVLVWTHHGRPAVMHPKYLRELHQLSRPVRLR